jgi:hypothetical protein
MYRRELRETGQACPVCRAANAAEWRGENSTDHVRRQRALRSQARRAALTALRRRHEAEYRALRDEALRRLIVGAAL